MNQGHFFRKNDVGKPHFSENLQITNLDITSADGISSREQFYIETTI